MDVKHAVVDLDVKVFFLDLRNFYLDQKLIFSFADIN